MQTLENVLTNITVMGNIMRGDAAVLSHGLAGGKATEQEEKG